MPVQGTPRPLGARVEQLFATFHSRSQPEQAISAVAQSVSARVNREVTEAEIIALRNGDCDEGPTDTKLLDALAKHFQVSEVYLTDTEAADQIDRELRMLAAARNAGVRHLALRGNDVDLEGLAKILTDLGEPKREEVE